jgi:hypothetical protein
MVTMYKSPGKFQISKDGTFIYNLKHAGYSKGEEVFANDISIQLDQQHHFGKDPELVDPEILREISNVICEALNKAFPPPVEEEVPANGQDNS